MPPEASGGERARIRRRQGRRTPRNRSRTRSTAPRSALCSVDAPPDFVRARRPRCAAEPLRQDARRPKDATARRRCARVDAHRRCSTCRRRSNPAGDGRDEYYAALDAADGAWALNDLDVAKMEAMLDRLLAAQLLQAHEEARIDGARSSLPAKRSAPAPDHRAELARRERGAATMSTGTKLGIGAIAATILAALIGAYVATRPPKCTPNERRDCPRICQAGRASQSCSDEGAWGPCECIP